ARRCASLLAACGFHVISGLALGIDGAAHAGALDGGGPTTACVAGGPEVAYPAGHRGLRRRILEKGGAVLSEYPPGTRPLAFHFPERNRIISGLCDAVLMVQAGDRSGALITVKTALDQNRDVLTVDRGERGPATAGNRRLIEQGAQAIREPEELLAWFQAPSPPSRPDPQLWLGGDDGRALRKRVLEALDRSPRHPGELAELLGCAVEPLAAQLSALLLGGYVHELPGDRFGLA
ncbi:MAG: DNA-protecting protein DprA, partial [Spirochaetes bacterium]|nr:DNA-protecting protein DprA [Spirochaetota bacterium]